MKFQTLLASFVAVVASFAHASISPSHDYHQVQAYLAQLAKSYPQNVSLIEIGQSDNGESIVGLQIGHGKTKNLIVATHHGNEYGSTEVALGAAFDFAKNPLVDQTLFIVPVLNITGFDLNRREESVVLSGQEMTLDANRDYPGPCATSGPFHLRSTKALADFIAKENIVASATLHTFGPLVLYPWGISTQDTKTAYNQDFISLANQAAATSHYTVGNSTEALYPADGTFEDYAFWQHGIWSLLFEIGDTHSPDEGQLAQMVSDNVPGLRAMLMAAPKARAVDHAFKGRCETRLLSFDRHAE
jgi:predicted deacylase